MPLRDGALGDIKTPLTWMAGGTAVVAVVVALLLFAGDGPKGLEGSMARGARRAADSVVAPVGGFFSKPVVWAGGVSNAVSEYLFAGSQNRRLKRIVVAAQSWRDEVASLRVENARLRALLGVKTEPAMPMVFATTVLDSRGPFANTRIADAGAVQGIIEGNPALSEHGLVGRVTGVSAHVSRIMLLTDIESRTPVLIARNNGRAILVGDGGPNPRLDYVRTSDPLRSGDRILTSGDGGVLPRGLPVGIAVSSLDGQWRVALDADASPIDDVRILLFKDFTQVSGASDLAPDVVPGVGTGAPIPVPGVLPPNRTSPAKAIP